jgi:ABC-2 type transport system permease protein
MLVYIPTITMGIWAEERRQGTDELLLTVPASDGDIVIGKYLAAVAIYTVSLLFSQVANFFVLAFLSQGEVDLGLFMTTYLGYWLVGLAMIALGMVGSFVTRNLTIGFIFGVLLNLPLVLGAYADAVFSGGLARSVSRFSYAQQFFDFGRGVISFRSLVFFALVTAIGLYACIVLVGRRHWLGGKDGESLAGHYLVRVLSLIVLALGLSVFFVNRDFGRIDGTVAQVNSLSDSTKRLITELKEESSGDAPGRVVTIEAFISEQIPEDYAMTRVDLISKLREFEARGGNRIRVVIHDNLGPYSEQAVRAEEQYGIRPATVMVRERGAIRQEDIFMGAAFTCGLEKVVVPFFDQGIPVEYELIRSISTVRDPARKKLGIVNTDAQMFGGFDMQRMAQTPKQLIVEELEKQYEVVRINPDSPIEEEVDVLMVVQPSSLSQPQMDNLVAAVRRGTPTAIFEDPMPVMMNAPGTSQPKMPQGGMMGMGAPPEPKGDIQALWDALGISMVGTQQFGRFDASIVWQDYNPYKKARGFRQITKEWVFASPQAPGGERSLNPSDDTVAGLQQILLLFPGAIQVNENPTLSVTPIISTGSFSGTINYQDLSGGRDPMQLEFKRRVSAEPLTLAVRIRSRDAEPKEDAVSQSTAEAAHATLPVAHTAAAQEVTATDQPAESAPTTEAAGGPTPSGESAAAAATQQPATPKIDVVYVGDIDLMHSEFLRVRAQPNMGDINWQFDNVTFVLNVVDDLAGDRRFLDVRKKETRHSTLKFVEARTAGARAEADEEIDKFSREFEELEAAARQNQEVAVAELQKKVDELTQKARESGSETSGREIQRALQAAVQQMAMKEQVEQRRLETTVESLTRDRDRKLREIERELDTDVQHVQNVCKAMALFLPMLPPLAIGLAVFVRRRSLESEGIASSRRR